MENKLANIAWSHSTVEECLSLLSFIVALLFWSVDMKIFAYLFFFKAIADAIMTIKFALLEIRKQSIG